MGNLKITRPLCFSNRNMPVPPFTHTVKHGAHGQVLTLSYGCVKAELPCGSRAGMANLPPTTCSVSFHLDGKEVTWHPGMPSTGNLQGTTRTLDGARGDQDSGADRTGTHLPRWVGGRR